MSDQEQEATRSHANGPGINCARDITIPCAARDVWNYLSDIRNAMTLNQFHESIGVDTHKAVEGLVVPIRHAMQGRSWVMLARITKCGDNTIAWAERNEEGYTFFPHSESWHVTSLDGGRCQVKNTLRGSINSPLGKLLGRHVLPDVLPQVLESDLRDLAAALGVPPEDTDPATPIPAETAALLSLMAARVVDGQSVDEFIANAPPLFGGS